MTGQWSNLKPDNPGVFLGSVAKVLGQYPPAIVEHCVDPARGLSRKAKFFSIAELVDWLDEETHYLAKRLENVDPSRRLIAYPVGGRPEQGRLLPPPAESKRGAGQ